MKTPKRDALVQRVYLEAILMGLCIGLAAMALNHWVGESSWRLRLVALALVGGGLCLLQYWVARMGRG